MTTWLHFVGGSYSSPTRFLNEAKKQGVSRRVPANVAKGFHYGDKVIFLRWYGNRGAKAFAEMNITSLIFDHDVAEQLGKQLVDEEEARYEPSDFAVYRECGSYSITGTYTVNLDIPELIKKAEKLSDNLFCMIGGKLSEIYEHPITLSPTPKFTRGFIKHTIDTVSTDVYKEVVAIKDYRRK